MSASNSTSAGAQTWFHRLPPRLALEHQAMREHFGDEPQLVRDDSTLFWRTQVTVSGRQFSVRIVYPDSYPLGPPEVYVDSPLKTTPHQFGGGRICWRTEAWNPGCHTAAVCLNAIHTWFGAYLVYVTLGRWPSGNNH